MYQQTLIELIYKLQTIKIQFVNLILLSILFTQLILPIKAKITFIDDNDSLYINQTFDYTGSDKNHIFIRSIPSFLEKSKSLNIPCNKVFSVDASILGNRIRTKCENNCIEGNCYSGYGEYEFGARGVYKGDFLNGRPTNNGIFTPKYGWIHKSGSFVKAPKNGVIVAIDIIATGALFFLLLAIMFIFYKKTKNMKI